MRHFFSILLLLPFYANPLHAQEIGPLEVQDKLLPFPQLPFQNNTTFGNGSTGTTFNQLNIQPVYPVAVGGVRLLNRAIFSILYRGELRTGSGSDFGIGDLSVTTFVSPTDTSNILWGIGPSFLLPTGNSSVFGSGKWSAGGGIVVLVKSGRWLIGALAQNVWSFAGDDNRADVNRMLAQYFINYRLGPDWYLSSEPIIIADWNQPSGRRWIVPVGGGVGKVFPSRSTVVNLLLQGFYNLEKPAVWGDWGLRLELKLVFVSF